MNKYSLTIGYFDGTEKKFFYPTLAEANRRAAAWIMLGNTDIFKIAVDKED